MISTTMAAPGSAARSALEVEEGDICGELVDKSGFGSKVLQRRSEIFSLSLSPRPDPKKGRRMSDPGRLLLGSLRIRCGGDEDPTTRGSAAAKEALMSSFPTGRLPDPRLETIRSLSPSAGDAAGEEGEAAVVAFRTSRSRSIAPTTTTTSGGLLVPERLANKRLSLPNAAAAASSSSAAVPGIVLLPAELGEAMVAVARADGAGSPAPPTPPMTLGGPLSKDPSGAFRRRRSISLECSRLEAILEENSHKQSRKYSLPPKSASVSGPH